MGLSPLKSGPPFEIRKKAVIKLGLATESDGIRARCAMKFIYKYSLNEHVKEGESIMSIIPITIIP